MAQISPLRGVRFNPEHVRLGGVLAPPYDVISDEQREGLYARDLRNIVRVDFCRPEPHDAPGAAGRYLRASQHLASWLSLGILLRERRPAIYVYDHEFVAADGGVKRRRGLFARIPAEPWDRAAILPHERTMRGPKEDRLALMTATSMQTSAVFGLWDRAPGIDEALERATSRPPDLGGRNEGEQGGEKHLLWVADQPGEVEAIVTALRPATLYIADGHHRYETAVAYAQQRRRAEPDAPVNADFDMALVYLCAAGDPVVEVLPTHRLVRSADGVPGTIADLTTRLDGAFTVERVADLRSGEALIATCRERENAFAVQARDGVALVRRQRHPSESPRATLDVVVLQEAILGPACGITPERIAEGALTYTRSLGEIEDAVRGGEHALGIVVNGCTTAELIAVSDAHEVMPQKSTYFYPKVPTGLVLSPL